MSSQSESKFKLKLSTQHKKTKSHVTLSQIKDDSLHLSFGSTVTDKEEKLPLKLATTVIEFLYLENVLKTYKAVSYLFNGMKKIYILTTSNQNEIQISILN